MYSFKLSDLAIREINFLANQKSKAGIVNNLKELMENPLKKAQALPPDLGDYFVNAGNQYCIIFTLEEDKKTINILSIKRQSFVSKILKK